MGNIRNIPLDRFLADSGYDGKFVTEINFNPYLFTEEEILDYIQTCEKYKFFYNIFGRCISGVDQPLYQLSGDIGPYIKPFRDCLVTTVHSKLPEHYIHLSFHTRCIICCQTLPSNIYQCLSLPVIIFDGPPQNMFRQINTPDPELTVKVFMEMESKASDPIPLTKPYQMEVSVG